MPSRSFNTQHGAVLIFSLVMLLLLTLASTSMIAQNKTQYAITSNTGQQIITFSRTETAVKMAEDSVEATRYQDPTAKTTCNTTSHLYEGSPITLPSSTPAVATVRETSCFIHSHEYRCVGGSSYTAHINSPENIDACNKLVNALCPTEVYVLDVTLTDSSAESARTISSKYAVGCEVPA